MLLPNLQQGFVARLKSWVERSRKGWGFLVITWLFLIAPATALELRIAVKDEVSQVQIGSSTDAVIKDSSGQPIGNLDGMNGYYALANNGTITIQNSQDNQLWVEPEEEGYIWIGDRWYRGRTLLIPQGNELLAINYVDLEEYLYSVVGAEAVPSWPAEALKAQAVAARTYALHKRAQGSTPLYDLDTTTNTQVYRGLESEYRSTHAAVDATAGQVMTYNGEIILAVFHASSGGHTENAGDIWSSTLPYLQGVVDYDQGTPAYQWRKSFSSRELADLIDGVGVVKEMIPERTTPRGRVVTMQVVGDQGTKRISGADLRKMLGLRSTLFQVQANGGYFQISGRGFGHGVGMSQWGAYNMARRGQDYRRILAHYYRNTILSQIEEY